VETAQHARNDVRAEGIEVVAGAIEVRRHRGDEVVAVIAKVVLAEFETGDLGQGVGLVGRLERAGEEVLLAQRLGRLARIDAGAAEVEQLPHAMLGGGVNHVHRQQGVLVQKPRPLGGVGVDPADGGGGDEGVLDALAAKEGVDGALVAQIERAPRAGDDVRVSFRLQLPQDRGADQPEVTGHVNPRLAIHLPAR
jgi:hypothetical protein